MLVAIAWFALYRNLVTSSYGVMLRMLRESPVLAGSLGLSPVRLRIVAYAVGAFPAGMAGCLFGFISLVVTPVAVRSHAGDRARGRVDPRWERERLRRDRGRRDRPVGTAELAVLRRNMRRSRTACS